jgi:Fe-S cluster assembly protein SufD
MNFPQNKLHSDIPVIDSYRILFRNGCYISDDQPCRLPDGIIVGSAANAQPGGNGFYVFVPASTKLSKPIQITNLFDKHGDVPIQSRSLVVMEAGSSAELLVSGHTISGEAVNVEDILEITTGEASVLELVRLQKMNNISGLITETIVQQAASSRMRTHFITLGGGSISNSLKVRLSGNKAEHIVAGLSLTEKTENVNNDILIVHASPDCQSKQLFKNILSDKSTGAYTGRIVVEKDAQKTIAYQRNNNILLHPKAKMNIRPHLEIYADDVKCSHGATVGQLDAEALFYLRSRGINENEAKKMLLRAFACEVIDNISCMAFRESIFAIMIYQ